MAHGDLAALDALDALLSSLNARDRRRRWFTGAADVHAAARWAADPERQRGGGLVDRDQRGVPDDLPAVMVVRRERHSDRANLRR